MSMGRYGVYDETGQFVNILACRLMDLEANANGLATIELSGHASDVTHKVAEGVVVAKTPQEIAADEQAKRDRREDRKGASREAEKTAHKNQIKPDAMKVKAKYPEVFDLLKAAGIIPESIT